MSSIHDRTLPFDIAIQGWTRRAVLAGTDYQLRHADRRRDRGDEADAVEAERRCDLLWFEIDRRDRLAADRETKKLARLRAKADTTRALTS